MPRAAKKTQKTTSGGSTTHHGLPEISQLFTDTVELFKKTAVSFLLLALIQTVISVAIFVAVGLVAILVGAVTGLANLGTLANIDAAHMAQIIPGLMAGFGIFLVALFSIFLFLGPAFQASLILLLGKYEGKVEYGKVLKEGFKYIIPVLLASLVLSFLTIGGMFVFFIPGIVIAILASFTVYEIVLSGKKPLVAFNSSVSLVTQHFWGVVGRGLLFGLVNFAIFAVLGVLQEVLRKSVGEGSAVLLNMIANIALMPLSMVFNVVLYRQVKAASQEKTTSPTWIWIVGIVGWVLLVVLGLTVGRGVIQALRQAEERATSDLSEYDWNQMEEGSGYPEMDEGQSELTLGTFTAINEYRAQNNLEPLLENPLLCYFSSLESEAEVPGFFKHEYSLLSGQETPQDVLTEWLGSEALGNSATDQIINNPDITQGCVTTTPNNVVTLMGVTE